MKPDPGMRQTTRRALRSRQPPQLLRERQHKALTKHGMLPAPQLRAYLRTRTGCTDCLASCGKAAVPLLRRGRSNGSIDAPTVTRIIRGRRRCCRRRAPCRAWATNVRPLDSESYWQTARRVGSSARCQPGRIALDITALVRPTADPPTRRARKAPPLRSGSLLVAVDSMDPACQDDVGARGSLRLRLGSVAWQKRTRPTPASSVATSLAGTVTDARGNRLQRRHEARRARTGAHLDPEPAAAILLKAMRSWRVRVRQPRLEARHRNGQRARLPAKNAHGDSCTFSSRLAGLQL